MGNLKQAQKFARQNLEAFPKDLDAIVTNAAGCGSGMDEYPLILKGTSERFGKIALQKKSVTSRCFSNSLVNYHSFRSDGKAQVVAYNDACHLANAQGVKSTRQLLNKIPGLTIAEVADSHLCCGSAGTYNVDQPEVAEALGNRRPPHCSRRIPI